MKIGHRKRYRLLLDHYGPQHWWPAESTFEVLIGAILTQNTNWRNVEKSLTRLRPVLTPRQLEAISEEDLAERIRPSGFNHIKTRRIKAFLKWYQKYDDDPEAVSQKNGREIRGELLAVNGIGPETADAMLVYAFGKPSFIADRYAMRLFSRMGDKVPRKYEALRDQVEQELADDFDVYKEYHALIVVHAKAHCRAQPVCADCPLAEVCARNL